MYSSGKRVARRTTPEREKFARSERFELSTLGFVGQCSIQLSYERRTAQTGAAPCLIAREMSMLQNTPLISPARSRGKPHRTARERHRERSEGTRALGRDVNYAKKSSRQHAHDRHVIARSDDAAGRLSIY